MNAKCRDCGKDATTRRWCETRWPRKAPFTGESRRRHLRELCDECDRKRKEEAK